MLITCSCISTYLTTSGAEWEWNHADSAIRYNSEWGKIEGPLTVGMGAYGDRLHIGIELEVTTTPAV